MFRILPAKRATPRSVLLRFLYLVAAGAGAFSLDHLLGHSTTAGRYART